MAGEEKIEGVSQEPSQTVEPSQAAEQPQIEVTDDTFDFEGLNAAVDDAAENPEVTPPVTGEKVPPVGEISEVVPPPPSSPAQPVASAPVETKEVSPTSAVVPTPEVKQPTTPQQPETSAASSQPEAKAEDGFTAISRAIEAGREQLVEAVAQKVYQVTPEELEALNVEPEKVIPKLLARVHVNTVQGVVQHIAAQMPGMVQGLLQIQAESARHEDNFFKAWPQLDKAKHGEQILKAGQVWRQLNPNGSVEEFIKSVGAQVVLMNNLHVQQPQVQQQVVPQQVQQAPFVPAGAGKTSQPVAPAEINPWAELVEVMNE